MKYISIVLLALGLGGAGCTRSSAPAYASAAAQLDANDLDLGVMDQMHYTPDLWSPPYDVDTGIPEPFSPDTGIPPLNRTSSTALVAER